MRRMPVAAGVMEKASTSHTQSSSMEGGAGAGGEAAYPWLQCIMGCKAKENTEVILLSCFHVICSGKCSDKFLEEVTPGLPLECRICSSIVERDQLSKKVIPQKEFFEKAMPTEPELICDNCVFDRPANSFCAECPALLCEQCSTLHPQIRATQRHVLQFDLTEEKAKQMEKEIAKSTQCKTHEKEPLSHMCRTCNKKICEKCLSEHAQHTVVDIRKEQELLASKLGVARTVLKRCDQAIVDINKKRGEILSSAWDNVMTDINEQFAVMMSVLLRRHREIRREAKLRFFKQLSALKLRVQCVEMTKSNIQRYIKTADNLAKNMDELASVNFLNHSDNFLQWISTMEKQLTLDFDRFVDKGWHFQVDASANIQAQKYLKEYCQVEYSYQPRIPKVKLKTYSGAKKLVKTSISAEKPDAGKVGNNTNNIVDNVDPKHSGRGFALKSTTKGAVTPPFTYSRKDRGTQFKAVVTSPTGVDKGGKRKEPASSTSSSSHLIAGASREDSNSDMDTTITIEPEAESPTPAEGSEDTVNASNIAGTVESVEPAPVVNNSFPKPVLKNENLQDTGKEIGRANSKIKRTSSEEDQDASTSFGRSNANIIETIKCSPDDDDTDAGSSEASTVPCTPTSIPESPERLLGKRERKKKSFPPGFVGTDQCWKHLRKQDATEAAAAAATTRLRQKSGLSKVGAGPSDAKMPRLQPETDDDGPPKVTDDFNQASIDQEHTQEYESSDGYASEPGPSTRRQSLRRRTIQKESAKDVDLLKQEPIVESPSAAPDEDPGQKRPRGKPRKPEPEPAEPSDNDEVDLGLPEAPKASIEEPPEFCDFPVQGQGIMKIKHEDDNDDYCCICLDGGEIIVCCDYCPKVFHLSCHIPVLHAVPEGDENDKWRCNYDTTKDMIDEIISRYPDEEGSENRALVETNKRHFILACKFLMECYKIPEIPTMRWKFPTGYLAKYGKVPYHLKYIKEKLCTGVPEHFASVQDMLLTFKQMFIQAFAYYQKDKFRVFARSCFEKFLSLVDEYYPAHRELFTSLEE